MVKSGFEPYRLTGFQVHALNLGAMLLLLSLGSRVQPLS